MPSSLILALSDQLRGSIDPAALNSSTLFEVFTSLPDPRKPKGLRHPLNGILLIAICSVLAGARSLAAMVEWAKDIAYDYLVDLGITVPHASTIGRVLARLDADKLDEFLGSWVRQHTEGKAIAIDGKELRGAKNGGKDRIHLLAALDHKTGVVLGQVNVRIKTNEIPMLPVLLDGLGKLNGVVITADALHTQRSHAQDIHNRGGHYVLTVKGNQRTLQQQLKSLPWKHTPIGDRRRARGHGKVVSRTIRAVTVQTGLDFPHATQAIQIIRRSRNLRSLKWRTETVYAITSLPAEQATPARLSTLIQGHWGIENRLHWTRDVTYGEDHSQVRTGNAPRTMASLRNLAISIHRLHGETNIAKATRHTARNPQRSLQLAEITTPKPTLH